MSQIEVFSGDAEEVKISCFDIIHDGVKLWKDYPAEEDVKINDREVVNTMMEYIPENTFCGVITYISDGKIVGCVITSIFENTCKRYYSKGYEHPCWIQWIVVDSSKRRSGIGKILMQKAEEWFVEHEENIPKSRKDLCNRRNIYIEAISESVQFYESIGYQVLGTRDIDDFYEDYFSAERNAIMAKPWPGKITFDKEIPLVLDETEVDDYGTTVTYANGFSMSCLSRLPQKAFNMWFDNVNEYECLLSSAMVCALNYNDENFITICLKFKKCVTKNKSNSIRVDKGHGKECRSTIEDREDNLFLKLSPHKQSAIEDILQSIYDVTVENE